MELLSCQSYFVWEARLSFVPGLACEFILEAQVKAIPSLVFTWMASGANALLGTTKALKRGVRGGSNNCFGMKVMTIMLLVTL